MEEANYSKRELDHHFEDIKDTNKEILFDVKEIKVQTYKTNGRVNKIEWKLQAAWWALGAVWSILLIAVPLLISFAKQWAETHFVSISDYK